MAIYEAQYSIVYDEPLRRTEPAYALEHPRQPISPSAAELGARLSFKSGIEPIQRLWMTRVFSVVGISLICAPLEAISLFSALLLATFAGLVAWRVVLVFVGLCIRVIQPKPAIASPAPETLPVYTILVPLYQEAAIVPQLAAALSNLNWPPSRLDIQILIEADDAETLAAAYAAEFPAGTRLIRILSGGPRTKPNALNVGLAEAYGRYLTVYDAEDLPHPDQLLAAHLAFARAPDDLVCLQAPLIGDAPKSNWISSQWALEYAVQFGLLMPSLSLYRMPILIGGTSNHFKTTALQALGGWDAWNVTEDADLGMRIARAGLSCGTISVPTHEDPPANLSVWMAQRSRWIKGFLQTWFVLMRTPGKTARQMGALPFVIMQVTLGGAILTPICHAPCVLFLLITAFSPGLEIGLTGWGLVTIALLTGFLSDLCAPGAHSLKRWMAMLTRPFYWPLHSFAAYRALWELAKAPFFWAKTPHCPRMNGSDKNCSTGSLASASPPA